ncbi:c-type cytochrome [Denitratisoma oestradiolicum]|uniref:Cytochrome c, class I n=1 Tax=Denitratisoma oestradiolicum TaxID=311182 RepID=A0A6S6XUK6_9PROT|nr:cytochrome c [Denitratisoma oestradiolicum]TWO80600.1 hypothetical protein CBW56_09190 [Denitratisoma oestradiolicum]CAB1367677.1 Cytochrome c, class I [Denitratisoma oestradiolicum]
MRHTGTIAVSLILLLATITVEAANFERGRQVYQMRCIACHGPRGEGIMPQTPKFNMGERLDRPDLMLLQNVKMGGNGQPPFIGMVSDEELLDAIAYIRTLR